MHTCLEHDLDITERQTAQCLLIARFSVHTLHHRRREAMTPQQTNVTITWSSPKWSGRCQEAKDIHRQRVEVASTSGFESYRPVHSKPWSPRPGVRKRQWGISGFQLCSWLSLRLMLLEKRGYLSQLLLYLARSARVQDTEWPAKSESHQRQEVLVGDVIAGRVPCY